MHPETRRNRPGGHVGIIRRLGRSPLEVVWKIPEALWRDPETRAEALGECDALSRRLACNDLEFCRPCGLSGLLPFFIPVLKRWAIFRRRMAFAEILL